MGFARIGLTGGIASGKSTIATLIRERFGIPLIDYDQLTAKTYQDPRVQAQILHTFATLEKPKIAEMVFADAKKKQALECIIHPQVFALAQVEEAAILASKPHTQAVLHDVPLLFELGLQGRFDSIIVVSAPLEVRIQRLVETRAYTLEHARARIQSGADDASRLSIADVVISGVQPLRETAAQLEAFLAGILPAGIA